MIRAEDAQALIYQWATYSYYLGLLSGLVGGIVAGAFAYEWASYRSPLSRRFWKDR